MASGHRPVLHLAPSVNTTTVVTTTTTTTTYAPITLPPLPPPVIPSNPKDYPLLHADLPDSLRAFPLELPGGTQATYRHDESDLESDPNEEVIGGRGWKMLRRDQDADAPKIIGLADAVERYGRKRAFVNEHSMEGVENTADFTLTPPRKKSKATPLPPISMPPAAPPSPLPSPGGSPSPQTLNIWPSAPPSGASSPQPQVPIQPDLSLTTLLALPTMLSHFSALPPQLQTHVLLTFLRNSPLSVIRTIHSVLTPTMSRDFLTLLPPELTSHILSFLPFTTLARASRVCKAWRNIIDSDHVLWRDLLKSTKIWFGRDSERAFARELFTRRRRAGLPAPNSLPGPHPYKILFKSRHLTRTKWINNLNPKHVSFPAHGRAVVTCLIFSHERIISASDDHSIHVYSPHTGQLTMSLDGHEGGVWALSATKDVLVSGSTDRTVRIWDLNTGRCTHVFGGHTSTVRCLAIVKPEWVETAGEDGVTRREKWPKRPMIVTGSRDHTLRVWLLPRPDEDEYRCFGNGEDEVDPAEEDVDENPYHKIHLEGHEHAVRALAARGRTLVSGSYDTHVRVWDIITGECKWILTGHTQKVYSVVLDPTRNIACSGSMDGTVRVWDLNTGTERFMLTGHTSLVGLLGLSASHLVSAAADSTLRIWDPDTGEMKHTLAAHNGAITCFQHDEFKVLSGSDGTLKMWDIRDGSVVRDLLTGIVGVWQVVFEGRWCVAASNRQDATVLDVWDFGTEEIENEDGTKELKEVSDWVGEPPNGFYEDTTDDEYEEEEAVMMDVMDQDSLEVAPSDRDPDEKMDEDEEHSSGSRAGSSRSSGSALSGLGDSGSRGNPKVREELARQVRAQMLSTSGSRPGSSTMRVRSLPPNDETPTRPRIKNMLPNRRH